MELKSIFKNCVIVGLLSCSLSVFAQSEKIKCPSIDFVRLIPPGNLNTIVRYDLEREHRIEFDVKGWDYYYDIASKLEWKLHIYVKTAQDYDFNEAFKKAQYALANIVKVENDNADENRVYAECRYLDKDGKTPLILITEKDNKINHMMK